MSDISSNNFAKDVPTKSVNAFANSDPSVSANSFAKESLTPGGYAWEGENMTGGVGIGDMMSGIAPGVEEGGGILHFKNRTTPPDITH